MKSGIYTLVVKPHSPNDVATLRPARPSPAPGEARAWACVCVCVCVGVHFGVFAAHTGLVFCDFAYTGKAFGGWWIHIYIEIALYRMTVK